MTRKLCTIQVISSLEDIPGKDKIKYASFQGVGFKVIVSADVKILDKVIYCEADTLLPIKPQFEFLRGRCYNAEWDGFRIKNMKMARLYSEGIVFPLDILHPGDYKEGQDVTDLIGAKKFDPELLEEMKVKHGKPVTLKWWEKISIIRNIVMFFLQFFPKDKYSWPTFAQKTDETRVQNLHDLLPKIQGKKCGICEKADGSSMTVAYYKRRMYVCSRNINLKDPRKGGAENNYWKLAIEQGLENKLKTLNRHVGSEVVVQGELIGPGCNGNKYKLTTHRFMVFNIRIISSGVYLKHHQVIDLCGEVGLEVVPLIEVREFDFKTIKELLDYADGFSVINKDVLREGVVIRSWDIAKDKGFSFKAISPSFDLKWSK